MSDSDLIMKLAAMSAELALLDSATDPLALVALRDSVIVMQRQLRQHAEAIEAALIEYIDAHGDIVLSDVERLYVGTTKVTRSTDDQGILMAVLEAGNGNLELLTTGNGGVLASQPWKHGTVRKLIGDERFTGLFTEEVRKDIKTGKPARNVKVYDSRFAAS